MASAGARKTHWKSLADYTKNAITALHVPAEADTPADQGQPTGMTRKLTSAAIVADESMRPERIVGTYTRVTQNNQLIHGIVTGIVSETMGFKHDSVTQAHPGDIAVVADMSKELFTILLSVFVKGYAILLLQEDSPDDHMAPVSRSPRWGKTVRRNARKLIAGDSDSAHHTDDAGEHLMADDGPSFDSDEDEYAEHVEDTGPLIGLSKEGTFGHDGNVTNSRVHALPGDKSGFALPDRPIWLGGKDRARLPSYRVMNELAPYIYASKLSNKLVVDDASIFEKENIAAAHERIWVIGWCGLDSLPVCAPVLGPALYYETVQACMNTRIVVGSLPCFLANMQPYGDLCKLMGSEENIIETLDKFGKDGTNDLRETAANMAQNVLQNTVSRLTNTSGVPCRITCTPPGMEMTSISQQVVDGQAPVVFHIAANNILSALGGTTDNSGAKFKQDPFTAMHNLQTQYSIRAKSMADLLRTIELYNIEITAEDSKRITPDERIKEISQHVISAAHIGRILEATRNGDPTKIPDMMDSDDDGDGGRLVLPSSASGAKRTQDSVGSKRKQKRSD